MDAFISRKRPHDQATILPHAAPHDEDSTEVKLALLASTFPQHDTDALLEALLSSDGSVEAAQEFLDVQGNALSPRKKHSTSTPGHQSSLLGFSSSSQKPGNQQLTRRGKTLHLYSPEDIASHTPCSLVLNFLPPELADALLHELLDESPTFGKDKFQLFDKEVTSPHTISFYVDNWDEAERQKTEYVYNGSYLTDVRRTLPRMEQVSHIVKNTVNGEIQKRIQSHYGGKKLKFQSSRPWVPNTSFVNCYDGGKESVGYHSDQLTYLGPRAVIGSISLGVAREFRVRKIVPRNTQFDPKDGDARRANEARADTEGQIAIHLPHNSLLVMHAEMQEVSSCLLSES